MTIGVPAKTFSTGDDLADTSTSGDKVDTNQLNVGESNTRVEAELAALCEQLFI